MAERRAGRIHLPDGIHCGVVLQHANPACSYLVDPSGEGGDIVAAVALLVALPVAPKALVLMSHLAGILHKCYLNTCRRQ